MTESLWDVASAARYLGMSKDWVYKQAARGVLPYRKIGGGLRFIPAEIRAWAESQPGVRAQG